MESSGLDIVAELGSGGTGVVYAARQRKTGRRLALKVLKPGLSNERVERFLAEARTVARIRHRGIETVRDAGVLPDGRRYVVSELLQGRSLARLLDGQRRVSVQTALEWGAQLLEALEAAHAAGVLHRDIKPSNIFVVEPPGEAPHVKLLDFGAACLGATAAHDRRATPASDVYSVGCMLFELISGHRPSGPSALLSEKLPGVPQPLEHFVSWLMKRKPRERPQTAGHALRHALALCELFPRRRPAPRSRRRTSHATQVHVPANRPTPLAAVEVQHTLVGAPAEPQTLMVAQRPPAAPRSGVLGLAALFLAMFGAGAFGGVWHVMPPEARAQTVEQVRSALLRLTPAS